MREFRFKRDLLQWVVGSRAHTGNPTTKPLASLLGATIKRRWNWPVGS